MDFGLTVSLNKTDVLRQDTEAPPVITIDDYELDAVCQFTYLGSTITDNLSLDALIDKRIMKAASTLTRLTARLWTCPKLSVKTNMTVYNAYVISPLIERERERERERGGGREIERGEEGVREREREEG